MDCSTNYLSQIIFLLILVILNLRFTIYDLRARGLCWGAGLFFSYSPCALPWIYDRGKNPISASIVNRKS